MAQAAFNCSQLSSRRWRIASASSVAAASRQRLYHPQPSAGRRRGKDVQRQEPHLLPLIPLYNCLHIYIYIYYNIIYIYTYVYIYMVPPPWNLPFWHIHQMVGSKGGYLTYTLRVLYIYIYSNSVISMLLRLIELNFNDSILGRMHSECILCILGRMHSECILC